METKNLIMKFFPDSTGPKNGVVTMITDSEAVPRLELYLQGEGACSICSPQINTYGAQFAQFDVGMYTSLTASSGYDHHQYWRSSPQYK